MRRGLFFLCFFFQAEDGIRDAQESRGLGDVYKRQGHVVVHLSLASLRPAVTSPWFRAAHAARPFTSAAVSYTHLTLPTIYPV